jgi:VWFA-related protein
MRLRILSFLAVLSSVANAQTPAEVAAQETSITFQSKVNIVLVPVVVRDKTGKPVDNLTKEDFQLFDKGKAQTISRVSVERSGAKPIGPAPDPVKVAEDRKAGTAAPGPSAPDHFIAFFFDDIHMQFGDVVPVRQAAEKYLAGSFKERDRAAIYTSSGQAERRPFEAAPAARCKTLIAGMSRRELLSGRPDRE